MSASPTPLVRRWRGLRSWIASRRAQEPGSGSRISLRARLTISVVALMAIIVVLLSIGTGAVLRGYLVHDLDQELAATMERAIQGVNAGSGATPGYAIGVPGQTEEIQYEDENGVWKTEHADGHDRPDTDVVG